MWIFISVSFWWINSLWFDSSLENGMKIWANKLSFTMRNKKTVGKKLGLIGWIWCKRSLRFLNTSETFVVNRRIFEMRSFSVHNLRKVLALSLESFRAYEVAFLFLNICSLELCSKFKIPSMKHFIVTCHSLHSRNLK